MYNNSINSSRSYKILEYLFILLILLNCNSMYYINFNFIRLIVNVLFIIILFILFITQYQKIRYNKYNIINMFLFLLLYSLIIVFCNFSFGNLHYIFYMCIIPIILLVCFYGNNVINNSLLFKFENIVTILAFCSLILWLLAVTGISPNMSIVSRWGNSAPVGGYFGLLFIPQKASFFILKNVVRNCGIFVEAPMYSYVLSVALFIELFIRKSKRVFTYKTVILLLTIISTISVTSIMIAIPAVLFSEYLRYNDIYHRIFFIVLIPISLILLRLILDNKVGNVTNLNSSYNIRMNDIYASIMAWKHHLFIGNGYHPYIVQQYMYSFRLTPGGNSGLSTGLFTVLAYGGIIRALFYIVPTFLSVMFCSYKVKFIALLNFILFVYTVISETYLCLFIVSYLIACIFIHFNRIRKLE